MRQLARVRWGLLVSALLLALVGLVTVHSASVDLSIDHLPRQAAWVGIGLMMFVVVFLIDYQLLTKFSLAIYSATIVLLLLVLLIGEEAGGARSWLAFGGYRLQPSELAKIATVLLLARYLAGVNSRHLSLGQIAVSGIIVAGPMAFVILQRDLGGAAMFVPMASGMLVIAGVRGKVALTGLAVLALVGTVVWNFGMLDYQRERVETFVSPGSDPQGAGYQLRQSKIAVGSGQLTGRGYLQGTQSQLRFLPALHTDFIFAVLAEEWGFLGVFVVLALYATYILNAMLVANRARDRAGILVVVGLLSGFAFHVIYNTGMVIGLLPITGVPLPFLSYGGSFTLANFTAAGLILGVDFRRYVNQ